MIGYDEDGVRASSIVDDTALTELMWLSLTMAALLAVYALIDVFSHSSQEAFWRAGSSLLPAAIMLGIVVLCRRKSIPARDAGLITGLAATAVALSVLYTLTKTGGPTEIVYLTILIVMIGASASRRNVFAAVLLALTAIGGAAVLAVADPGAVERRSDWGLALAVSVAAAVILHRSRVGGLVKLGRAQDEIERIATVDALTGVATRYGLSLGFPWLMAQARRQDSEVFAMFADVDGLKSVNDSLGHDVGDQLIKAAATALRTNTRSGDLVVRWGGDEFVVVGIGSMSDVGRVEQAVTTTMRDELAGLASGTAVSLGTATSQQTDGSLEALIAAADEDMIRRRQLRGHHSGQR